MGFFTAIITLTVIILLALLVNRIAAVALVFTGMSREMAKFQARSAFSTVGFTTSESESVVNHPVRRRIIGVLMLLGNAGFVGMIATVLGTFTADTGGNWIETAAHFGLLAFMLSVMWLVAMSKWLDDQLFKVISWAIKRWTDLDAQDFSDLLRMGEGYSVTEMEVEESDWLRGHRLDELRLGDIGVNVLGIKRRDNTFVGGPTGATYVRLGDRLLIYGAREKIVALDEQRSDAEAGKAHKAMVEENRRQWKRDEDKRKEGYSVTEMVVRQEGWLAGKRLSELNLSHVGVVVLGIERRDGEYVGIPVGSDRIYGEDKLIIYGSDDNLAALELSRNDPDGEEKHRLLVDKIRAERLQKEDAEYQRRWEQEDPGVEDEAAEVEPGTETEEKS